MVSKEGALRHRFITMLKSALVDVAQFARASLPRDPIHIVDYAVARCLSIRLSVRLLHTGILLSKRLHVSSNFFSPSGKGKGKCLDTCYSAAYTSKTRDQQRFTISEVLA